MLENIKWLGHDGFKIKAGDKVIYLDPFRIGKEEPADIILITHEHYDHCSPADVSKIQKKGTIIVATPACKGQLSGDIRTVKPGDRLMIDDVQIEAVPAYNVNKNYHPKRDQRVGYILIINNQRIYHAGDTDLIPEMDGFKCDIALLPVSGTYVMTAEEAAQAAERIKPKIAIPMHYGAIVGSEADAERFKKLCRVEVRILRP